MHTTPHTSLIQRIIKFFKIGSQSVMVIGQQKGNDLETRVKHNFGMAKPEGYRKAVRLMEMADRFNLPIVTFIDTAGAYPRPPLKFLKTAGNPLDNSVSRIAGFLHLCPAPAPRSYLPESLKFLSLGLFCLYTAVPSLHIAGLNRI